MPAVSIAVAIAAAYWMLEWEAGLESGLPDVPFIYHSGRDASLAIVGTIVGSLMTVAGVTFSITIVSLTLASSQFGPRLLRNFLRSWPSQVTLGALIGSFVYGILIMTGMDDAWDSGDAHPSVSLMIFLACVCVSLIVFYIHHVATSIQADELVASVYLELESAIDSFAEREGIETPPEESPTDWGDPLLDFRAPRSGYVTAINCEGLCKWAEKTNGKIRFLLRPGQFVARGECVAYGFDCEDEDSFSEEMGESLFVKGKRTPEQDLEFLVDQLVEVALRAISPGINDPNTAVICIDYLAAALCQLKDKSFPSRYILDSDRNVRLFVPYTDFEGIVDEAFNQLRQCGASYPDILIRLLKSLCSISHSLHPFDSRQDVLRSQFDQLVEAYEADESLLSKDRRDIEARIQEFRTTSKA